MGVIGKRVKGTRVKVGKVPVDSGQVFVVDPCYVLDGDVAFEDDKVVTDNPYSRACAASCSDANAGPFRASANTHIPLGKPIDFDTRFDAVCTSTGWGDGLYPVYIEYGDDGRVARLIVEFMENDHEWWEEEGFDSEYEAVDHYEEQEQDNE